MNQERFTVKPISFIVNHKNYRINVKWRFMISSGDLQWERKEKNWYFSGFYYESFDHQRDKIQIIHIFIDIKMYVGEWFGSWASYLSITISNNFFKVENKDFEYFLPLWPLICISWIQLTLHLFCCN